MPTGWPSCTSCAAGSAVAPSVPTPTSCSRRAGLTDITQQGTHIRFAPVDLPDSRQVRVQRLYPKTVLKPTVRTMLVPVPRAVSGRRPSAPAPPGTPLLRDAELLAWCAQLVADVFGETGQPPAAPAGPDA